MYGLYFGIPIAALVFLAVNYYTKDQIGDPIATNALALSIASLVYFFARAIDVLENKERDNPKPIISPQSLPECFGNIKEMLTDTSMGPNFWQIRLMDADQGRLSAFMKWTETQGGGLAPTLQIARLVLLDVVITAIPEEEKTMVSTASSYAAQGQSNIQLTWRVDSPVNRLKANELQEVTEGSLKEVVGLKWLDKPKERSPFMPPKWLLLVLLFSIICAGMAADRHQAERERNQTSAYPSR